MKRIGPWTEPWGTLQVRSKGDDYYFIYCYYLCPTFLSLRLLFSLFKFAVSLSLHSLFCLYIFPSLSLHSLFSDFTFAVLCLYIQRTYILYIHSALSLHSLCSVFTFSPLCLYILTPLSLHSHCSLFLDVFWTVVVEPP